MSDTSDGQADIAKTAERYWNCFMWIILVGLILFFVALGLSIYVKDRAASTTSEFQAQSYDDARGGRLSVTNSGTESLKDVHVTITLYFEKGDVIELERRWSGWPADGCKDVDFVADAGPLQKVEMHGEHATGWIAAAWLFDPEQDE